MYQPLQTLTLLLVILLTSMLSACGGGGGSEGPSAPRSSATPPTPVTPGPGDDNPLGDVESYEEELVRFLTGLADEVIAPSYSSMEVQASTLRDAADTFCTNPAGEDIEEVRAAWFAAMTAWQRAQFIRVGPVEQNNVRFRLQFFPDTNAAVINNVQQALASRQEITPTYIAGRPVGAQGFPAIEYLLYELLGFTDADTGPRRCQLLQGISANIVAMSNELNTAWTDGTTLRNDFSTGSGIFNGPNDPLVTVLESFALMAEEIADRRIAQPIEAGDITLLESYWSETSLDHARTALQTLAEVYENDGADIYRLGDFVNRALQSETITQQMTEALEEAQAAANIPNTSLVSIVSGQANGDLEAVADPMQRVAQLVVDIAIAADVNLGFNNQDGD